MERTKLLKAIEDWRAKGPAAPPRAMVLAELPKRFEQHVFVRGNPNQPGAAVSRHFPRVLVDGEPAAWNQADARLALARAIANPGNPLTARVLVNRVWLEHFGAPLVATPSDFGLRSAPPTHPALLDHLASRFIASGWSLKTLHRQIVLSAAYQQASDERPEAAAVDPENVWLWRMNRRRLDFEATRDALLAVAGRLRTTVGGPGVKGIDDKASSRRTIYSSIDRLNLPGLFRTFDFPNPDATSPERTPTTVPQQALFFMNAPLVREAAKSLPARADVAGEPAGPRRIARLYRVVLGREPADDELAWCEEFISAEPARPAAWDELAQALLEANEFVFID